ncbi:hypothetical protein PF005_g20742 [Phytophthora fragariae]|uniref:Uncharacterized protein n=4 Tax=Phytophthora fragariae TaxID=53985 RepID=A0A6A4CRM2_9STRA|nr:hypothetical protein PF009_g22139 [Phytophthora fragariae]KAE8987602.1 hypothetical protein PF011_g19514 [Phytophthora fragariae]KAE9085990.1 hypothetical protein PF010_g20260 [Phytophthora fragariae]KAE9086269.1 hypothetical protein PF007_g20842 [Phytophthora fragariae]KAE9186712.1 hypothetical protein PF005_g20742 [Phytophthora fragariae]
MAAPTEDLEVEGVTAFGPPPATEFRYVIELKNRKISLWMEDSAHKTQWYKGDMVEADYVTHANVIPGASKIDYVKYFQGLLDCRLDDSGFVHRSLTALDSDTLRLELNMKLSVFHSTRVATYTFDLHHGSVERIHALETKVRALLAELARLQSEDVQLPSFLQLEAEEKVGDSEILCWGQAETSALVVSGGDGLIKARRSGVYNFKVVVNSTPTKSTHRVQLVQNGRCIQTIHCASMRGQCISAELNAIVSVATGDALVVKCDSSLGDTSYLYAVDLWS